MAALLDNGSVVHYKDALRVPNGGEAMHDDMKLVRPRISVSMAFCISNSVRVPPLEVASSKSRCAGRLYREYHEAAVAHLRGGCH